MSKKLQLTITEPCHEKWDSMNPVEKGRFCGSCQKQVIDFSSMSDRQIAEFFKRPSTASVCGRFMSDQLDRDIQAPRKRSPWLKYFFQLVFPAFFLSKATAQQKMGRISRPANNDTTRIPVNHEIRTLGMVLPKNIIPVCKDTLTQPIVKSQINKVEQVRLNGRVVNEEGESIRKPSIRNVQSGEIILGDDKGMFTLMANKEGLIELEISANGYSNEKYIYPFTLQYSSVVDIAIQMQKGEKDSPTICNYIMGGVIREDSKVNKTPGDSAKNVISPPVKSGHFLVYPNPVKSGSILHISIKDPEFGIYNWHLMDMAGKTVQVKTFNLDEKSGVIDILIPHVAAGTYLAMLVNKRSGKKLSEKIIIEH